MASAVAQMTRLALVVLVQSPRRVLDKIAAARLLQWSRSRLCMQRLAQVLRRVVPELARGFRLLEALLNLHVVLARAVDDLLAVELL